MLRFTVIAADGAGYGGLVVRPTFEVSCAVIYLLGIAGAAFLGVGWVMQQRVAARWPSTNRISWQAMRLLIRSVEWWGGIAAAAIGQTLAAWALQEGAITLVEPLMVASLFFAFVTSACLGHHRISRHEFVGTALLAAAVAMFLSVANPHPTQNYLPGLTNVLIATAGASGVAFFIVLGSRGVGRRRVAAATAGTSAAAAGIFYALQDVGTRGAIVAVRQHGYLPLLKTAWPYVLLFGATAGVLLAQEAFRAARLDWSLPPTAAVQPLAGVALGVGVLSDHLSTSPGGLTVEAFSIVLGIAGVAVIGHRMRVMRHHWAASIRASRKSKHTVAAAEDYLAWERREQRAASR